MTAAALVCFCKPIPPDAANYLAVSAREPSETVQAVDLGVTGFPKFAVVHDRLYLQTSASSDHGLLVFSTVEVWDRETIRRLRKEHPELERYWPKPDQEDGGVAWLSQKQADD